MESGTKMSTRTTCPKTKSGDDEDRGGMNDEHVKAVANAVNYSRSLRTRTKMRGRSVKGRSRKHVDIVVIKRHGMTHGITLSS